MDTNEIIDDICLVHRGRGRPRTKPITEPKEKKPVGRPKVYNNIDEWRESKRISRKKAYAKKKYDNLEKVVEKLQNYLNKNGYNVSITATRGE
jgi:hypothetical protein